MTKERKQPTTAKRSGETNHLEDYSPGTTEQEFLDSLRKAIHAPPKKPFESPAPTSSKT